MSLVPHRNRRAVLRMGAGAGAAAAGVWALETLNAEAVLESATERWGGVPGLDRLVHEACARVASKWDYTGDPAAAAEAWALQLVREYAEQEGVELREVA